jgi:alcohol dehydrogenase class IV
VDRQIMSFKCPGLIHAGLGAIQQLSQEAKALDAKRALLVTDEGVLSSGIGQRVQEQLGRVEIAVETFDKVMPDPDIACAQACAGMAKAGKYDLIVGLGGGSSMDIASISSVMCTNSGDVQDYLGINLVRNPGVPTILIPTTAGTGAEATPNAIVTDTAANLKKAVVSPYIFPTVAIVDPLLTVSMPQTVTSSSGIDALTHAIECYTSKKATPLSDLFAKEAIVMIGRSLRTAVADGGNLEARYDMSIASLYGGIAIANSGVTAVHALAYPLGGQFNVAHGVANGLLLPYVMAFNAMGSIHRFAAVARFMGERVEHLSLLEQAKHAAKAVKDIYRDLKIPQSLRDLQIPKEAIPEMAQAAMEVTRLLGNNPRRMTADDAEKIYYEAYEAA